jgi:hypothetical protein
MGITKGCDDLLLREHLEVEKLVDEKSLVLKHFFEFSY